MKRAEKWLFYISTSFKLLIKTELMITSAHPVLQIPAILPFPVKVHWLFHLVFPTIHAGLTRSPKTKVYLSHRHLKISRHSLCEEIITALALQWLCLARILSKRYKWLRGTPITQVTRLTANFREQRTDPLALDIPSWS